jgi:adenine-specific DNA-methyltransferase
LREDRAVTLPTWTTTVGDAPEDPAAASLLLHGRAENSLRALAAEGLLGDGPRLVYLDPPYRTGKTFSGYRDTGRRSDWLTMMRTVLESVHDALRPDGTVWVHLDDREPHRVRTMLDEVFGSANSFGDVAWERKQKPSFLHGQLAAVTDHLLVAAKDRSRLGRFTTGEALPARRVPLHHPGNPPSMLTFPPGSVRVHPTTDAILAGDMSTPSVTTRLLHDVRVVDHRNVDPLVMEGPWRWTQQRLEKELADGVEIVCPRLPLRPHAITGSGSRTWATLWSRASGMATNEDAGEHGRQLFGVPFDTAKPEELLERIILTATDPGDLVVDLFAGSGTTAAVAHKRGRRWISVEQSASVIERHTLPRLTKVVRGGDPGGITVKRTVAGGHKLPADWTPRYARRAGQ